MKKIITLITAGIIVSLLSTVLVYAQVTIEPSLHPDNAPTVTKQNPSSANEQNLNFDTARNKITARVVNTVLGLAGVVAIFFIINNAWYLTISAGQEEKITQHKKGLMWAVIGLVLIILSYSIIRFVISIPFQAQEKNPAPAVQQ